MWLSYALIRLLIENETVIHHSNAGTYLFFGNSVYTRTLDGVDPPAGSATFCLIDLDRNKDAESVSFMTDKELIGRTFPVMACPSMPTRYEGWRNQRSSVPKEYMPLWKRDELKKG
jgi:hypothetical protein